MYTRLCVWKIHKVGYIQANFIIGWSRLTRNVLFTCPGGKNNNKTNKQTNAQNNKQTK